MDEGKLTGALLAVAALMVPAPTPEEIASRAVPFEETFLAVMNARVSEGILCLHAYRRGEETTAGPWPLWAEKFPNLVPEVEELAAAEDAWKRRRAEHNRSERCRVEVDLRLQWLQRLLEAMTTEAP